METAKKLTKQQMQEVAEYIIEYFNECEEGLNIFEKTLFGLDIIAEAMVEIEYEETTGGSDDCGNFERLQIEVSRQVNFIDISICENDVEVINIQNEVYQLVA